MSAGRQNLESIHDAGGWEPGGPPTAIDVADPDAPELYYARLDEFVEEFFAPTFGRDLNAPTLTWCPQWWRHAEALYRLDSLWRSWEHLRQDAALGSATWLREHLDHHLPILLATQGPFRGCSPDKGHQARDYSLPCESAPATFF